MGGAGGGTGGVPGRFAAALASAGLAACGGAGEPGGTAPSGPSASASAAPASAAPVSAAPVSAPARADRRSPVDPTYVPVTVGPGSGYRPPPGRGAGGAGTIGRLACRPGPGVRRGVHLELFARSHVVVVPAGIGVLGPRVEGPYVRTGRCFGPVITLEPTGVVELAGDARGLRHGDLFAIWGQPVSRVRLAGFGGGRVRAYVDGRVLAGDPARIALRPHREIVLEIAGSVPPHAAYRVPPGL
ncbi:MAG: hypothetical protein QOE27_2369 [Solirubrobacteraceae bacterium]|nr:hypothetical protein [Solirubrobacteraceae bacterium]